MKDVKILGTVKNGKDYYIQLKGLKRLCIQFFGLGFIFATPKVRCVLMETMNEFIDDLVGNLDAFDSKNKSKR